MLRRTSIPVASISTIRLPNQTITYQQNGRQDDAVSSTPLDEFHLLFSGKTRKKGTEVKKNVHSAEEITDFKLRDGKAPLVRSNLPTILKLWSPLPQQNIIKHGHIAKFLTALANSPIASRSATLLQEVRALVDNPKSNELHRAEADFFNELANIRETLTRGFLSTSILLNALPPGQLRDACIAYVLQQDNLGPVRQATTQELQRVQNPAMRASLQAMVRHSPDFATTHKTSNAESFSPLLQNLLHYIDNSRVHSSLKKLYYDRPSLPDEHKRQTILSIINDRDSYDDYYSIVPAVAAVGTFHDPKKQADFIRELQEYGNYDINEGLKLAACIQAPEKIAQLDKATALPSLAAEGLKPFIDRGFSLLDVPQLAFLLEKTGRDASALITTILPAYDEVMDFALKHPDRLVKTGSKPPSKDEIRARFHKQGILIMQALILTGVPTLKSTIHRKRLDNLLEMIPSAISCSDLLKPAHQLSKMTAEPADNYKLVEFITAFSEIHKEKELKSLLNKMLQNKKLNVKPLGKAFLTAALDSSVLEGGQIADDQIDKWDKKYLSTLASALRDWRGSKRDELIDLCKATVQGRVQSYLHDPATKIGRNNLATQKAFETTFQKQGLKLNYQQWLHYPGEVVFEHLTKEDPPRTQQLTIKLWERNPGRDLFLGNYTGACIALDSYGGNSYASVQANQNTFVQVAYLYDETKNVVGKGLFYWGENTQTGEPVLILNTFEGRAVRDGGYEYNQQVRDKYVEFAKQYSRAVLGYVAPLYTGTQLNPLYRDDLQKSPINMHIVGSALNNRYYLDSLPDDGDKIDAHYKPNNKLQLLDSGDSPRSSSGALPARSNSPRLRRDGNVRRPEDRGQRVDKRVTGLQRRPFVPEDSPFALNTDSSRPRNQRKTRSRKVEC